MIKISNKWNFAVIALLIASEILVGLLLNAGAVPYEVLAFTTLAMFAVPVGWVFVPIIEKWLHKRTDDLDTYDCWLIVKKRVKKTTRSMIPNDEYIPKSHKILELLGLYICEINPDDVSGTGNKMVEREAAKFMLILMKLKTRKIIWETNKLTWLEFFQDIEKYSKLFISEQQSQMQFAIPTKTTEYGAGYFNR